MDKEAYLRGQNFGKSPRDDLLPQLEQSSRNRGLQVRVRGPNGNTSASLRWLLPSVVLASPAEIVTATSTGGAFSVTFVDGAETPRGHRS